MLFGRFRKIVWAMFAGVILMRIFPKPLALLARIPHLWGVFLCLVFLALFCDLLSLYRRGMKSAKSN